MTASTSNLAKGCPHRSCSQGHRIERQDYSEEPASALRGQRADSIRITLTSLRRAGRARLRASSSTERSRDGWLDRPLSPAGEAEFTGVRSPIDVSSAARLVPMD